MASASEEPDNFHDLRIVLLGVSGVGKSATGNAILDRDVFKETQIRASEVQRGRVEDRNISVIDTPGFFNTELTDEDLQNEMMKSLSLSHPGPHVFLLIINLQKVKEDNRNLVKLIQEIFEESLQFIMILFIGRENMSRREFPQFIENGKTEEMLNCVQRRYHVMNSIQECDTKQIKKLLKNIHKMVTENGGQCYNREITEQTERRKHKEKITQEELKKRHLETLKTQEERNERGKQKKILYEEEKTERGDMRKHEDVGKERRDAGTVKEINPDVLEDFKTQMKCPREKERQKWALQRLTQDSESRLVLRNRRQEQKENQKQKCGMVIDEKNTQSKEEEKNLQIKEEEKSTESEEEERKDDDSSQEDELVTGADPLAKLMVSLHLSEKSLRSLERSLAGIDLPRQDLRIVLLGELESGKSSTGNTILGRDAFKASMASKNEICEKQETMRNGKTITIIDTPSLLVRFQDHLESEIEECIEMCAPGPHVFLLVIKLSVEFKEENQKTIKWIQQNFDEDVLNHTIVLFTWADVQNFLLDEPLTKYIQKNNALKSLIDSCGGRYHSFNNRDMTNRVQVTHLLNIDKMMQRNEGKHYNKRYISKKLNRKQADEPSCEIQ